MLLILYETVPSLYIKTAFADWLTEIYFGFEILLSFTRVLSNQETDATSRRAALERFLALVGLIIVVLQNVVCSPHSHFSFYLVGFWAPVTRT